MGPPYETCIVFLTGYPGMGKRTVGGHLAQRLDGVLVDNQLINRPLLELFRWDGKSFLPPEFWDRVVPIREAVLGTIEDLAPRSNSCRLHQRPDRRRGLPRPPRRCSGAGPTARLALPVRGSDRRHRRPGQSDRQRRPDRPPEGIRSRGLPVHRLHTTLLEPPADEVVHLDTTPIEPATNAETVFDALVERGYQPPTGG